MRAVAVLVCVLAGVDPASAAPVPATPPPAARMSADEFVAKLRADPKAAEQFDGKRVELTGTTPPDWLAPRTADLGLAVSRGVVLPPGVAQLQAGAVPPGVVASPEGLMLMQRLGQNLSKMNEAELPCELPPDLRAAARELGPNQQVRVTGWFVRGQDGQPGRLTDARFEAVGPPTARAVTAGELADELAKKAGGDPTAVDHVVVRGEVGQVTDRPIGPRLIRTIEVKSADGKGVHVVVQAANGDPKPQGAVRVKCVVAGGGNGPNRPVVRGAVLPADAGK